MSKGFGRVYPQGRMNGEDDGQCRIGVASDPVARKVVIRFDRPTSWIGLELDSAMALLQSLAQKTANTFGVEIRISLGDKDE